MKLYSTFFLFFLCICSCQSKHEENISAISTSLPDEKLNFITVGNGDLNIRVGIPVKWVTKYIAADAISMKEQCDSSDFCSNAVLKFTEKGNNSLSQVSEAIISSLTRDYSRFNIVAKSFGAIQGDSVAIIDYVFYAQSRNFGSSTMILTHGNKIVSINYLALNEPEGAYARQRYIFQKIIDSIRIIKS